MSLYWYIQVQSNTIDSFMPFSFLICYFFFMTVRKLAFILQKCIYLFVQLHTYTLVGKEKYWLEYNSCVQFFSSYLTVYSQNTIFLIYLGYFYFNSLHFILYFEFIPLYFLFWLFMVEYAKHYHDSKNHNYIKYMVSSLIPSSVFAFPHSFHPVLTYPL